MKGKTKHTTLSEQFKRLQKNRRGKFDIHDRSLSWLGTGTSIKSGGAKPLIFLAWYRHFNKKWRG